MNNVVNQAAARLLLGQYKVQTTGKEADLVAKDRYVVADAYIRLETATKALLDTIRESDIQHGCGDRVFEEESALKKLRELTNHE